MFKPKKQRKNKNKWFTYNRWFQRRMGSLYDKFNFPCLKNDCFESSVVNLFIRIVLPCESIQKRTFSIGLTFTTG